jgi:hypothetical protein
MASTTARALEVAFTTPGAGLPAAGSDVDPLPSAHGAAGECR